MNYFGAHIGKLLSLEGIAIDPTFHGQKLGKMALTQMIQHTKAEAVGAITRNPQLARLVGSVCQRIFPNIDAAAPLTKPDRTMMHVAKVYARHVGATLSELPFVTGRYPTEGLYGRDPGVHMPFTEITDHIQNGLIVVGLTERMQNDAA